MPSNDQIIYVVDEDAPSGEGHCTLEGGGVLVCQFDRMEAALEATAGDPALRLVRHKDLSSKEQARVEQAFLR